MEQELWKHKEPREIESDWPTLSTLKETGPEPLTETRLLL